MVKSNELVMFHDGVFELDVRVSATENTVWLTLDQIASLFERTSFLRVNWNMEQLLQKMQ